MDVFTIGHGTPCPYVDVICDWMQHAVHIHAYATAVGATGWSPEQSECSVDVSSMSHTQNNNVGSFKIKDDPVITDSKTVCSKSGIC